MTSGSPSKYSSNNHSQQQIEIIEEAVKEHSLIKSDIDSPPTTQHIVKLQIDTEKAVQQQSVGHYDSNTSTRREGLDLPLQPKQPERITLKQPAQPKRQKTNSIHHPSSTPLPMHKKQTSSTVKQHSKGQPSLHKKDPKPETNLINRLKGKKQSERSVKRV